MINHRLNRRLFLKRAAVTAGAFSAARFLPSPNLLRAQSAGEKLSSGLVGCGIRGLSEHVKNLAKENIVASVDVHEKQHALVKKFLEGKGQDTGNLQAFTDYRRMFDKVGKQIDAVFVATPNHHH